MIKIHNQQTQIQLIQENATNKKRIVFTRHSTSQNGWFSLGMCEQPQINACFVSVA